jgi:crotonobetaine/carnitine-CoA ligase
MQPLPAICLGELIRDKAASHPDLDVLTFVDVDPTGELHEEVRTYRGLWDAGRRFGRALIDRGMRPGDRFALLMPNHPQFVEAMVGAALTGTVFVPIDPRTRGAALAYMLAFAEVRGVVATDLVLENVLAVRSQVATLKWIFVLRAGAGTLGRSAGVFALEEVCGGEPCEYRPGLVGPETSMQLLYTSGTTGEPKAIATRHARFANAGAVAELFGYRADDRPFTGLSLTHANAQMVTLSPSLRLGLRAVIGRKFSKSRLWDITRRYGCTVFNLIGGMTVALHSEPRKPDDADNPVRRVISAGMPAALWRDFQERFAVEILEFYGAAEGGLTINPPGVGPVGSVGKPPLGMEVAVLDENGAHCPPGVAGEICFRMPGGQPPVLSYEKNPDASARKTAGGWLHMGDIGHLDENGWLFFHYRAGAAIRRNGEFIDARVVEAAVADSSQIADAFVYGVPAQSGAPGEKDLVAAVVARDTNTFDADAVFLHCQARLPANLVPSYLQQVDEIPKTASEKPQERMLLRTFAPDAANVHVRSM